MYHDVASNTQQTSECVLQDGAYFIVNSHPNGVNSMYLVKCMYGYTPEITPIISDSCASITINVSNLLTITTNKFDSTGKNNGNYRWWHIIKICGGASINVW